MKKIFFISFLFCALLSNAQVSFNSGATSLTSTEVGYGSSLNRVTGDTNFKWNATSQYLQLYNKNNNSASNVVRAPFTVSTFTDMPINGYNQNDIMFTTIANSTEGGYELWGLSKSDATLPISLTGLISQTTAISNFPAVSFRGGKRLSNNARGYLGASDKLCGWTGDPTGDFKFMAIMSGQGHLMLGDSVLPQRRLDVKQDNGSPQARLTYSTSSIYTDLQSTSGGAFSAQSTGNNYLFGSTTSDPYSIGAGNNFLGFTATSGSGNSARLQIIADGTGTSNIGFGNASIRRASISAIDGSALTFNTNASNSGTTVTQGMRITSAGNVIIGTNVNAFGQLDINSGTASLPSVVIRAQATYTSTSTDGAITNDINTNHLNIVLNGTSCQLDRQVAAANITSGTYTPSITNIANLDGSTAFQCQYLRVGNTITVSGKVLVDPTTNTTLTELQLTLPVASDFTTFEECGGTGCSPNIQNQNAGIFADSVTNKAEIRFICSDTTSNSMYFTFTYKVN